MSYFEIDILIDQLDEYIKNPYINQAVLLHGAWGSGKTHFIKNEFPAKTGIEIIYTSANGISSEQSIVFQINSKKILGKFGDTKAGKAISTLVMGAAKFGLNKVGNDVKDLNLEDFIFIKENTVIVIDDIERLAEQYSLISFLGFVNNLTEHEKVKVVLIGEEDKLKEKLSMDEDLKKRKAYEQVKEKYIYRTFFFSPELKRSIPSIINAYQDDKKYHDFLVQNQDLIIDIWQKLEVVNLRTIKFYLDSIFTIYKVSPENIEKIKRHFLVLCAVLSKYYKEKGIDLKSPKIPTVLDREFPKVYSTIDRKALEIYKDQVKENDALFPPDFQLEYSSDYIFLRSFYDSIILGNTISENIQHDIENLLMPKEESQPWQKTLDILKYYRIHDHKTLESAFTSTLEFITQNKYDLNELVMFVNFSVEFIQKELISDFPDIESLCDFIKPTLKASLSNTQFNFIDQRRLTLEDKDKIECIKLLEEEIDACKELLIKQFYRSEIDGLLTKASEDLEYLTPENLSFIVEQGNSEDLDAVAKLMTDSIKNINGAYQIFIEPNFYVRKEEKEIQKGLQTLLNAIEEKSKKDKVMEYVANEIIAKFPTQN